MIKVFLRSALVRIIALAAINTAFFAVGMAQSAASVPGGGAFSIMPLSELKEGSRGVARTVFAGSEPEEFNVEILGVVPGAIGPHQDMIIGRLSGPNAERTFVFAGMSGSPVYIDGKVIGAISYSFPFSKEPICGITPIEQMLSIFETAPGALKRSNEPRPVTIAELQAKYWQPDLDGRSVPASGRVSGMTASSRLMAVAGQTFAPIATPVTFSGISQATLDAFAPELTRAGLLPVAALGGTSKIDALKPANETTLLGGDSVVVQLARGDVSISAAGTVTLRDNNRIYAFGHPYFGLGTTNLPMSESHVVTVVPNANNSFKLAVSDATVGSMTQDRATGIYGLLGQAPAMLPVHLTITTSRGGREKIDFESGIDDFLTPLIVNIGTANSLGAYERGIGDITVDVSGTINIRGEEPVTIDRKFSGAQAGPQAAASTAIPLATLLKSNFEGLDITSVDIHLKVSEGSRTATLEKVTVDRSEVRAGDEIELRIFARASSGILVPSSLKIRIPEDTPPGQLSIMIGDGSEVQKNAAIQQFVPKTPAELIRTINSAKRPDMLYVFGYRTTSGAIVGASEMPNLPPSVLATMNSDRSSGGTKSFTQKTILDEPVPAGDYVVTGSQTLTIEVVR